MKNNWPKISILSVLLSFAFVSTSFWPSQATGGEWPFFVFDNGVGRGSWTPELQAAALKKLGYDGISYNYTNPEDLKKWLEAFSQANLKIFGLYVHTFPDRHEAIDPKFPEAIKLLAGTDVVIWMTFRETKEKRDFDEACVRIAREMGDLARESGVRVAIYPHAGFYAATAADSLRIAEKAAHPLVGPSYNLCHEFMTGNGPKAIETLRRAASKATLVSINGVDATHKNYICTLDSGDFDIPAFLRELKATGYRGPVGLQCYNIKGDIKENLKRSMAAWHKAQPGK